MAIIWVSFIDSWCEDLEACCSLRGSVESFQERLTFLGQLWNLLSIATQVSLPLGLDLVPTKYQLSKAGSPGGSNGSCTGDWVGTLALSASQDAGRQFPRLTFPMFKALRAPESRVWSPEVPTGKMKSHPRSGFCRAETWGGGGGKLLTSSSQGSQIPKKHNCQSPNEKENLPREFKKVQNKNDPNSLKSRGMFQNSSQSLAYLF